MKVSRVSKEVKQRLVEIACENHEHCKKQGFYDDFRLTIDTDPIVSERLFINRMKLIICEAAEFVEAQRVGMIQPYQMPEGHNYKEVGKGYCSEEIADIVLRTLDFFWFLSAYSNPDTAEPTIVTLEKGVDFAYNACRNNILKEPEFLWLIMCAAANIPIDIPTFEPYDPQEAMLTLATIVGYAFALGNQYSIDTMAHIEAKFAYNKTRPYKHGKAF